MAKPPSFDALYIGGPFIASVICLLLFGLMGQLMRPGGLLADARLKSVIPVFVLGPRPRWAGAHIVGLKP